MRGEVVGEVGSERTRWNETRSSKYRAERRLLPRSLSTHLSVFRTSWSSASDERVVAGGASARSDGEAERTMSSVALLKSAAGEVISVASSPFKGSLAACERATATSSSTTSLFLAPLTRSGFSPL